ncbi:hypothetical protein ACYOEI_18610 [Singulisphaera rosea]
MRSTRRIIWRLFGMRLTLGRLDHADIEKLYKRHRLPLVEPFLSYDITHIKDGAPDPVGVLTRYIESFQAILAASLFKSQPWLEPGETDTLVTIYCRERGEHGNDNRLYRQTRMVGDLTLDGLDSQHRERFAALVSLAAECEWATRVCQEVGNGSRGRVV